jgi:hypothetical protein
MANTSVVTGYDLQSYTPGLRVISGSFAPNGSSALASSSTKGVGFTVSRTGVGTFLVTLTAPVVDVVSQLVGRTENTAGTFLVTSTAYSTSARTFTIKAVTPAAQDTAADVAANANNRINFTLTVKTVKGTK